MKSVKMPETLFCKASRHLSDGFDSRSPISSNIFIHTPNPLTFFHLKIRHNGKTAVKPVKSLIKIEGYFYVIFTTKTAKNAVFCPC